jgi:hypothetical protein
VESLKDTQKATLQSFDAAGDTASAGGGAMVVANQLISQLLKVFMGVLFKFF